MLRALSNLAHCAFQTSVCTSLQNEILVGSVAQPCDTYLRSQISMTLDVTAAV